MSHLSPCVFLLWSVLTVCLIGFFTYHIWNYDRFRCLNIWRGRDGTTFKRFMTYSYILVFPVLVIYMFSFAIIKYDEGWIILPNGEVIPKPIQLWSEQHRSLYFPLNVLWTLSWVSEATTHIEELCFWLYLIHSGSSPKPWFKSAYFRFWFAGTIASFIIMLAVTISTKADPLKNEAYTQFAGSMIGLLITLGFLPVLWVFPNFIRSVRAEGGDLEAIMRLAKFHDLNIVRTIFRLIFLVPILMLSIDGLTPHTHELNMVIVSADLLSIVAGIGCIIQSAITLVIFFPRNLEHETQKWLERNSNYSSNSHSYRSFKRFYPSRGSRSTIQVVPSSQRTKTKLALTDSPEQSKAELPPLPIPGVGDNKSRLDDGNNMTYNIQLYTNPSPISPSPASPPLSGAEAYPPHPYSSGYNQNWHKNKGHDHVARDYDRERSRHPSNSNNENNNNNNNGYRSNTHAIVSTNRQYNSGVVQSALTEANMRIFEGSVGRVNPMALYFTSPIDIYEEQDPSMMPHRRRRMAYL